MIVADSGSSWFITRAVADSLPDSDTCRLGSGRGVPDLDGYYAAVSDHVLQAVSMIRAELDCDFSAALGRLRIRATAVDQTLDEVALDVIGHSIRFSD